MSRYFVTLNSKNDRVKAVNIIAAAPAGTRVEIKAAKRTLDQNSLMWAMLSDVAMQLPWHGQKITPDDWKLVFLDALKGEVRTVPNIEGNGFVSLRRSSDLSKDEMSNLIYLISAFGAEHGVKFNDNAEAAA
jgi:hypothetical protein